MGGKNFSDQDWWTTGILAFIVFLLLGSFASITTHIPPPNVEPEVKIPLRDNK